MYDEAKTMRYSIIDQIKNKVGEISDEHLNALEIKNIKDKVYSYMPYDFEKWPEDDWVTISDRWDMNIWKDDEDYVVDISPVINGETQTSNEIELVNIKNLLV